MAPTTVTTIVMVMFALFVIAWGLYNLLGDWEPAVRQLSKDEKLEIEYQQAVREMRQAIEDYERGKRQL
jgi:hypothetical protein